MYCIDRINYIHLNGLLLFLVLLFSGTKSSATSQCLRVCPEKNEILLSSTGSTQEYGLKPINLQLNSYCPFETQSSIQQFMTCCDIAYKTWLNTAAKGIDINIHKRSLELIALLFPFHGFT